MEYAYPNEVFYRAVETMIKSPGKLQNRIQEAFELHFYEDKRFDTFLPIEIREQFNKLSKKVATGEILKIDDEEALSLVKEILYMAHVVTEYYYKEFCQKKLF